MDDQKSPTGTDKSKTMLIIGTALIIIFESAFTGWLLYKQNSIDTKLQSLDQAITRLTDTTNTTYTGTDSSDMTLQAQINMFSSRLSAIQSDIAQIKSQLLNAN